LVVAAGYKFLHSRSSVSSCFLAGSKTPNFCITKIEAKIASFSFFEIWLGLQDINLAPSRALLAGQGRTLGSNL
jgi:hypothetical protein